MSIERLQAALEAGPTAWMVRPRRNRKFVRACWTSPPSQEQSEAAELDGDEVTPMYEVDADTIRALLDERDALLSKYNELLFSVGNKYPGETRHETALRYIRKAETSIESAAMQQEPAR